MKTMRAKLAVKKPKVDIDWLNLKFRWFIEPRNKLTNDTLSENLSETNYCHPDDKKGLPPMWECPRHMVEAFKNNRFDFLFKVWWQVGDSDRMLCPFDN